MTQSETITNELIVNKILFIRGKKIMMDRDLAEMYGVETKRLNEQVKRNKKRFPPDFMFQMTEEELKNWKSQFATSNKEKMGLRKLPNVFTEQGVAMLSSVLNSETAIAVNIQIIRIFTRIHETLFDQQRYSFKSRTFGKESFPRIRKIKQTRRRYSINFQCAKTTFKSCSKRKSAHRI